MVWLAALFAAAMGSMPLGVPADERAVLDELFQVAGGSQWLNRDGWSGPPGSECSWHGVDCYPSDNEVARVVGLHLNENNLSGSLPASLGKLEHLHSLWVFGNHLRPFPEEILSRWDNGLLELNAGGAATDVDEIHLDYSTSVLCVDFGTVIRRDGSVTYWKQECRPTKGSERPEAYCVIREGRIWHFDRLARTAALYAEPAAASEPDMGMWIDVPVTTVALVRGQHRVSIESGVHEPPLRHWLLDQAITAALLYAEWTSTSEAPSCPRQ